MHAKPVFAVLSRILGRHVSLGCGASLGLSNRQRADFAAYSAGLTSDNASLKIEVRQLRTFQ
jgi:hypothetical protein